VSKSVFDKLDRTRKPRVHITYQVEVGGAIENRQIPFVVGVMSDLSGNAGKARGELRDGRFVNVDSGSFNDVLGKINPGLEINVPNTIAGDASKLGVKLEFKKMDDFLPENLVKKIPELNALQDAREKLHQLSVKVNASHKLEKLIEDVVQNTEALKRVKDEASGGADAPNREGD